MGGISSTGNARSAARTDASGGREVVFVRNAAITKTVSVPASTRLSVRARGDQCAGAPNMRVTVDGSEVMSVQVPGTGFLDYVTDVNIPAGSHTFAVSFTNDFASGCDRNLRVDKVELSTPAATSQTFARLSDVGALCVLDRACARG